MNNPNLSDYTWEAILELMDDELREWIHAELAPCTRRKFLDAYCVRHLEEFGVPFEIARPTPVW